MSIDRESTDAELVAAYLDHGDQRAFEILLDRHHPRVLRRIRRYIRSNADIEDLLQQVWMRVLDNIGDYREQGKFGAYVDRVAANLLTDEWRRRSRRDQTEIAVDDDEIFVDTDLASADIPGRIHDLQAMDYLTGVLIPRLPCEQRLAFLLKHESEYWDGKKRLEWDHLASLNGIDTDEAWRRFERVRNHAVSERTPDDSPGSEEMLIFLVWTQAQRPSKKAIFTEQYFADLLDMPVGTFKTRYRAATQALSEGLRQWRSPDAGGLNT